MEQKKEGLRPVHVGILGFGTVGTGVYRILTENKEHIAHRERLDVSVDAIYVRGVDKAMTQGLATREQFVTDAGAIIDNPAIDIVCECMGGIEPARSMMIAALEAGKTVVTANKECVAKHWPDFEKAAKMTGAGFYIEATSAGGIPIIRTLLDATTGNEIERLMGIVNGTCNYILTRMTQEGAEFDDVLADAQRLGYAEADPTADVDGWDSVYKLSILGSIAFHSRVDYQTVYREGIRKVSKEDIAIARDLGYVIKLLAIGKKVGGRHGRLELRVHPTMIPVEHPLASVSGSFNAVFLHGDAVDDLMLYGRGAGQMPTGSAMVGDLIYAAHRSKHAYMTFNNQYDAPQTITMQTDWHSEYCLRIQVCDNKGVLEQIAHALAKSDVSIRSMMQRGEGDGSGGTVTIVIITHTAKELSMQQAVETIRALECVYDVKSVMRVEH